jgi:hypothetical protein
MFSPYLKSLASHKKIGWPNLCGTIICGWSRMGDSEKISGIYREFVYEKKRKKERLNFYPYVITHTTVQQINRSWFAQSVSRWQVLSFEDKEQYNKRAVGMHMSGYNLWMKEHMLLI